jgi:hypothetical protein
MMNCKDGEGSSSGLVLMYSPGIYPEGLRKPRKTSVRIAGLLGEI